MFLLKLPLASGCGSYSTKKERGYNTTQSVTHQNHLCDVNMDARSLSTQTTPASWKTNRVCAERKTPLTTCDSRGLRGTFSSQKNWYNILETNAELGVIWCLQLKFEFDCLGEVFSLVGGMHPHTNEDTHTDTHTQLPPRGCESPVCGRVALFF